MTKKEQRKNEQRELLKEIKESMKNSINGKVLASVKSVSSSGMSRVINFYYISKEGYIFNLNYKIAKVLNYRLMDKGVRVYGCGMDMIFNTLYNLNILAVEHKIIKQSKNKSKRDLYYNGIVNTSYMYL